MRAVVVVAARVILLFALAAVTWTSLSPADRLPETPDVSDKVLHLVAYAILGVFAALSQRRTRVLLTVALLTAFGYLIEILQGRTGYRDFDFRDLLADALGAAFGVLLVAFFRAFVEKDDRVDWDARYSASQQVWSGHPNGALVAEVESMTPGRVLDVGCGEGADAVWLAQHGWDVTALDVSQVALDRAQTAAAEVGVEVRWLHAALLEASLESEGFDLVSVQYPALDRTAGSESERGLLDAVAVGGTLLVVLHADVDHAQYVGHDQLVAVLGENWAIELDERRARSISGGGGAHHTHDIVLRALRLR